MDETIRPYYRDYISNHGPYEYQSLHITFYDNSSRSYMEVQLRTCLLYTSGKNSSKNSVGIGLAMARQIFLQQNGTIEAASEPGKGTSFRIRFYTGVSL